MLMFSERFLQQDAEQIEYNGKIIHRCIHFERPGKHALKFRFLSSNSPYIQAVILHLPSFEGVMTIDGKEVKKPKRKFPQVILDEEYAPEEFVMEVTQEKGGFMICNGCLNDGIWRSLSFGSAMILEELGPDHYIVHCNDYDNDDDFDDFIFELEIREIKD